MPEAAAISVQNKFIKGLITEATGLSFPEDACTDSVNTQYDHLGLATRRPGFDLEAVYHTYEPASLEVVASYLWSNVGGDGDQIFTVLQLGDELHFYKISNEESLSAGKHATVINLRDFDLAGTPVLGECQFSSGNGRLFVTNRKLETFYVEYNADTNVLTAVQINIQIRDFQGDLADPLGDSVRPPIAEGALTAAHRYNLLNQGWSATNLTDWDTARADMPSNSDIAWLFKDASDAFDFTVVDDRTIGNSVAPKGHFIYNVFNINRSTNVASATDEVIDDERFSTSAFHAGRIFYSGLHTPTHTSRIYFSQVIENSSQYGKCYQVNDPASEKFFDLLPSDGGVVDILDAGLIHNMVSVFNMLIIFASNGIWAITGSQGLGFAATDYTIQKISSVYNVSHTSLVVIEGIPHWWNLDGIYNITLDKQTNTPRVQSITDASIRSYYLDIPSESKQFARGAYDPFKKKVYWIYKTRGSPNVERYTYDAVLVLNTLTGAFFPWTLSTTPVQIKSIVNVFGIKGGLEEVDIFDENGNQVIDVAGRDVTAFVSTGDGASSVIKYVVSFDQSSDLVVTFAEASRDTNIDWFSYDGLGQGFLSYFVTGYMVRGKGMNRFQDTYLNLYSKSDIDTSYSIVGAWDYALSGNSARWSSSQLFREVADGYSYKHKRIKIRGHGLACQFKITSNGADPFQIMGWSIYEMGAQKP